MLWVSRINIDQWKSRRKETTFIYQLFIVFCHSSRFESPLGNDYTTCKQMLKITCKSIKYFTVKKEVTLL